MDKEYDFSTGVKKKFTLQEEEIEIPVYLEKSNQEYFLEICRNKNIDLSHLINNVLAKDKELMESMKK